MRALLPLLLLGSCAAPQAPSPPPPAPELRAAELLERVEVVFRAREYRRALGDFQLVASEAERQGDRTTLVQACSMVARCYTLARDLPQARFWLERARGQGDPGDPLGWSRLQLAAGHLLVEERDRAGALEVFGELHAYCREHGLSRRAAEAAYQAALLAPLEARVTWTQQGLDSARAASDERWQALLWSHLGQTQEQLGRHEDMLAAHEQARVLHRRTGSEREVLAADWAVGRALRFLGRLSEARTLLLEVLDRAQTRHGARPGPATLEWVGYSRWELGEVEARAGERARAAQHLEAALEALVEAGVEAVWPAGLARLRARLREVR